MRQLTHILLLLLLLTTWAEAETLNRTLVRNSKTRVALVIGNSAYEETPLRNPVNDAKAMKKTLEELGFNVAIATNADRRGMLKAISRFGRDLRRAEIGFFFYAGHGMGINNRNYLIPVGAIVDIEDDVESEGVDVNRVLTRMRRAGNRLNVVVLDACRNNPFSRSFRSGNVGLVKMTAPPGTLIAYATSPGSVAADGEGKNGLYTGALLEALRTPDAELTRVFNNAGLKVMKRTDNRQIPWVSSTPLPPFSFGVFKGQGGGTVKSESRKPVQSAPSVSPRPAAATIAAVSQSPAETPAQAATATEASAAAGAPHAPQVAPVTPVSTAESVLPQPPTAPKVEHPVPVKPVVVESTPQPTAPEVTAVPAPATLSSRPQEQVQKATLTVHTRPNDARVRILNIKPKYHAGIELAGDHSYRVEVASPGWKTEVRSVDLKRGEERSVTFKLVKEDAPAERVEKLPQVKTAARSFTDSTTGMQFVFVKGGCFQMGFNGRRIEKPVHKVCLSSYYIGKYEVTQSEWKKVMGKNPSKHRSGDRYPVERVSYDDTVAFLAKLSRKSGRKYRLPTEAEWEYAATGRGRKQRYSGSNSVGPVAWYDVNSGGNSHQVGTKRPNNLGIYDMSGNVYEWCSDWFRRGYRTKPVQDPTGPKSGRERVRRGGSWRGGQSHLRAAFRNYGKPTTRYYDIGFRVVLPVR